MVAEGSVGVGCCLAFDAEGRPALSYCDLSSKAVKYARFDGSDWIVEVVAEGISGGTTSLAFDAEGRPVVAWAKGGLYCAIRNESTSPAYPPVQP